MVLVMTGYVDPTAVPQAPVISEKEDIAQCLGVSTEEVTAAGRLLFIFGHRLIRREPVTSSQLSKIYVESKFSRREFGKNKNNDSNATVRRLLSTWCNFTKNIETLARTKECCASGCTVYEPHRLCTRRDNSWNVYFMRPFVWEELYADMDSWSDRVKEIFDKVTITDPNLTFFDAENEMVYNVENEMVYNVEAEDTTTTQHHESLTKETGDSFGAQSLFISSAPPLPPPAPAPHVESEFARTEKLQDDLWEQLFPFRATQ